MRDIIARTLKTRLAESGWKTTEASSVPELQSFDHLDPPADMIFTVAHHESRERRPVAIHFIESSEGLYYSCSMRLPNGRLIQEHGGIDAGAGAIRAGSLANWEGSAEMAALPPEESLPREAPEPDKPAAPAVQIRTRTPAPHQRPRIASSPRLPRVVKVVRKQGPAGVEPSVKKTPVERSVIALKKEEPVDESRDFLAEILRVVPASGSYALRWAWLRRTNFPGPDSWSALKAWCARNDMSCEIGFSQSSKDAEVQFRSLRRQADMASA